MDSELEHHLPPPSLDAVHYEKRQIGRAAEGGGADEKLRQELNCNSPITYLYLTFETLLPSPNLSTETTHQDNISLPQEPDLTPYMSPLKWSPMRKNLILLLACVATFLTAYSAGAYSPPAPFIARDLSASELATLVGITTWCLGFALAPMVMAPISEIWGRYPVFVVSGIIYVIFQAVCSVVSNLAGMLIARFLVGVGSSVFSTVVGGVIADVWDRKERNTPMAIFSGAVLAGTGAGPLVSSAFVAFVNNHTVAWKWTFWHQVIMNGLLVLAIMFFLDESRAPVILRRKAQKLNQWYNELEDVGIYGLPAQDSVMVVKELSASFKDSNGAGRLPGAMHRIRWIVKEDEQRVSLSTMMATSVRRPIYFLFTEPVVFCFSLWAAFSWGVLYLSFSVVPFLYARDFDMSSRVYVAMIASAVVATITGVLQEQLLSFPKWRATNASEVQDTARFWAFMRRKFPAEAPEARLYFACITTLLLPAGLYGAFLCPPSMGGHAPAVGLGFATWGIYSVYLATFNYLADTYHIYASSALAAQSCCRNLLSGIFPLITGIMFTNLGIRGAGGILGGMATILTAIPWILVFYGESIRSKSKFAIVSEVPGQ